MDEIQRQGPTGWQFVRQYFGRIVIGVILGGMAFSAMTVVLLKWRDSVAVDQCLQNTKRIGIAFYNYLDTYKCLPEVEAGECRSFGWRGTLIGWFDASPVPSEKEIRSSPAHIFNLSGRTNPNIQSTTVYAVTGDKTAFGPANRCRTDLPLTTLLLISGRASKGAWHSAENVLLEDCKGNSAVRDVVGETCNGITFLLFLSGESWAIDSSVPCEFVARCAEVMDAADSNAAQQALLKYRLKNK